MTLDDYLKSHKVGWCECRTINFKCKDNMGTNICNRKSKCGFKIKVEGYRC